MPNAKLVKGTDLTPSQLREVLKSDIFKKRATSDNPDGDVNDQHANTADCGGRTVSDMDWVYAHAFYIKANDHLAERPAYCEPYYMADY